MVQHGCNCSGYSDYIRMVTIKNNHCCNNSHGGYNSVWTHGCGAGCTGGSFWGGFGTGIALSLTNWLVGGLSSCANWFTGGAGWFGGGLNFGGFGLNGMSWLSGGNNGSWYGNNNNNINNAREDYFSSRYGSTKLGNDDKGTEQIVVAGTKMVGDGDLYPEPEAKSVEQQVADYEQKLNVEGVTIEALNNYKEELEALIAGLSDADKARIEELIDKIDEKIEKIEKDELLQLFNEDELKLLAQINKNNDYYKDYVNAKPEDLIAEGAKVLYARDIVGQANGTIRDVEPQVNTEDKVTISDGGKTIKIQDSKANSKEITYKYVQTIKGEALYKSENGQLYVLQKKKTSTGEYVLNQYEWHYGTGKKDVSSANV